MDKEDVGRFYTRTGSDIWRMVCYQASPSAEMENVLTKERVGGAIGSLLLDDFIELRPVKEVGGG